MFLRTTDIYVTTQHINIKSFTAELPRITYWNLQTFKVYHIKTSAQE
jgi:hypothetical protein